MFYLTLVFCILAQIHLSVQHGYLAEPPSRASAWLNDTDFLNCCKNYDYNQMYCGGFKNQWENNGGRCGVCGDPWDEPEPRTYEKGGAKYLGKIVRTYQKGAEIPIVAQITANHLGYFEFRICKVDGWSTDATQGCLNRTLLTVKESNSVRHKIDKDVHTARLTLLLPNNLACEHCVLQWKYATGNSWGYDPETNQQCLGCGPVQENFFGCSDISIKGDGTETTETTEAITTTVSTTNIPTTTEWITTTPYIEPSTTLVEETTSEIETTTVKIPEKTTDYLQVFPIVTDSAEIEETTTPETTTTRSAECRIRYEFGTKMNIARIVQLYCNRMCNVRCKVILSEYEKSIRRLVNLDIVACLETCPALCDCP